LVILLLDRLALALGPLPTLGPISVLILPIAAMLLAWRVRRRFDLARDRPWLVRTAEIVIIVLLLSFVSQLAGYSAIALLLGRGVIAGAILAVYIYAAVTVLDPFLCRILTSRTFRRSNLINRNADMLRKKVGRSLLWAGVALWLYMEVKAMGVRDVAAEALNRLLQMSISIGSLSLSVGGVAAFVITLMVARTLAQTINGVLEADFYPRRSMARGVPDAISAVVRYGFYTLGFIAALAAAGIQISQISILLGGFGIGVGLGLQDLVKNFAAGLTLLGERRLNVGDALQIQGQDIFGRVRLIGIRATVVRCWNGSEVLVPNADLVSGAVTNWTLTDRLHRVEVDVGVAYGTDLERVIAILLDVARSNENVLKEPPPQALFVGFGDSALNFSLRAWTDLEYERSPIVTSDLALAVNRRLVEAEISMPFPQRDLHLASVSPDARAILTGRDAQKQGRATD
jgi:small-conductance mechanosensitive channel